VLREQSGRDPRTLQQSQGEHPQQGVRQDETVLDVDVHSKARPELCCDSRVKTVVGRYDPVQTSIRLVGKPELGQLRLGLAHGGSILPRALATGPTRWRTLRRSPSFADQSLDLRANVIKSPFREDVHRAATAEVAISGVEPDGRALPALEVSPRWSIVSVSVIVHRSVTVLVEPPGMEAWLTRTRRRSSPLGRRRPGGARRGAWALA